MFFNIDALPTFVEILRIFLEYNIVNPKEKVNMKEDIVLINEIYNGINFWNWKKIVWKSKSKLKLEKLQQQLNK